MIIGREKRKRWAKQCWPRVSPEKSISLSEPQLRNLNAERLIRMMKSTFKVKYWNTHMHSFFWIESKKTLQIQKKECGWVALLKWNFFRIISTSLHSAEICVNPRFNPSLRLHTNFVFFFVFGFVFRFVLVFIFVYFFVTAFLYSSSS